MYFQILDYKNECFGFYADDCLIFDQNDERLKQFSKTWNYTPSNIPEEVKYAKILCGGKSLTDACPDDLEDSWKSIRGKIKAFERSFKTAQVDLSKHCFFDLLPEYFLYEYFDAKNKITKHIFENYQKPANYEFIEKALKLTKKISLKKLNIDFHKLNQYRQDNPNSHVIKNIGDKVLYDVWGSKTGRLSTKGSSFPILNLKSEYRDILKPSNHYFVEIDFNSAELRTLLGLSGKKQPEIDIHEWNNKNILKETTKDREAMKEEIFGWLYNPYSENESFEEIYGSQSVLDKYYDGKKIETIFNRKIESDSYHALNYIIQSTSSDLMLESAFKIDSFLQDKKSHIAALIHDSIVLDVHKNDLQHVSECASLMADTRLGNFLVSVEAGKDFGNMKKIDVSY